MSERTREREVDEIDVGGGIGTDDRERDLDADAGDQHTASGGDAGLAGRAKSRAASLFSLRAFLLALGAALVGVFALGNLIPVVPFTGFVGLFLVMFGGGLIASTPRYLEAGVAGAASGALALAVGSITLTFVTGGLPVAVGAAVGAAVALVGFYAGRDLRDGLTRDLD